MRCGIVAPGTLPATSSPPPRCSIIVAGKHLQAMRFACARIVQRRLSGTVAPRGIADGLFTLTVRVGGEMAEIPAKGSETVLVSMERANLAPPSRCRSGERGFCRALLVSGDVFVVPDGDGRRAADKGLGYIHPCASYPLSDLEVWAPRGT